MLHTNNLFPMSQDIVTTTVPAAPTAATVASTPTAGDTLAADI